MADRKLPAIVRLVLLFWAAPWPVVKEWGRRRLFRQWFDKEVIVTKDGTIYRKEFNGEYRRLTKK